MMISGTYWGCRSDVSIADNLWYCLIYTTEWMGHDQFCQAWLTMLHWGWKDEKELRKKEREEEQKTLVFYFILTRTHRQVAPISTGWWQSQMEHVVSMFTVVGRNTAWIGRLWNIFEITTHKNPHLHVSHSLALEISHMSPEACKEDWPQMMNTFHHHYHSN